MRLLISMPLILLLCGCADLGYYWHSARGHLAVMNERVDIDALLDDDKVESRLRERLALVRDLRRFSIERLALPDNDSYQSYVALDRPYVVQNLFAAPEFSTRLHQWCYPVIGCASYRGYYDEERLQAYAQELKSGGLEVHVAPVSAYSTLGWFDDPVLSSFIDWPDYRLAGLLFHELTHQRIYIDDDTAFNESLASAVQQAGTELWLRSGNRTGELELYHRWLIYRAQVIELIESTRTRLAKIYAGDIGAVRKREQKAQTFAGARAGHDAIAAAHQVEHGFTKWFAGELNNAKLGSVAAYNANLPSFMAMLEAHDSDFDAFFGYVVRIAKLDKPERDACLDAWKTKGGVTRANRHCEAR